MKRFEAPALETAYGQAAKHFGCSIFELDFEVIQHPSGGLLGLFKKPAIIIADRKRRQQEADESVESLAKVAERNTPAASKIPTKNLELSRASAEKTKNQGIGQSVEDVLDSFFDEGSKVSHSDQRPANNNLPLAERIEADLKALLDVSCFAIDTVEVDVVEHTALIFIDGEDAPLLIGKEGYRYNALSYLLFNWLHTKYDLYIKLEIAQFLTMQQEMIANQMQPVIEQVHQYGRAKTRPLDGILVQIALEQLREAFPDKYVAAKTGRDGRKFVVVNAFNHRTHD
jgi:spoIIIJ-associated protein